MHLSTFALPIALSAVTTIVFASPVAPPQLQSAEPANSRYKRALDDLTLKVKYPELFRPNAKRAEPSHQVCTQDCPGYANSPVTCRYVPGAGRRKRSVTDPDVVMLRPEDAARYFLGRGRYTTVNGTTISDDRYLEVGHSRREFQILSGRWAVTNWVRGKFGNLVMDLGVPVYKKWKRAYKDQPDYAFWLSDTHGFYMGDLEGIEKALLDTPGWTEIEVGEWRLSRKLLELGASASSSDVERPSSSF